MDGKGLGIIGNRYSKVRNHSLRVRNHWNKGKEEGTEMERGRGTEMVKQREGGWDRKGCSYK